MESVSCSPTSYFCVVVLGVESVGHATPTHGTKQGSQAISTNTCMLLLVSVRMESEWNQTFRRLAGCPVVYLIFFRFTVTILNKEQFH